MATSASNEGILLVGIRLMAMGYLRIPNTFDEIIPPVYNPSRSYIGGMNMNAPKRIVTLTLQKHKLVIQGLIEDRHTRAMHLYMAGMPLELVSQWLGHSQHH